MKGKRMTKARAAAASLAMMATVGLSACGGGSSDAEATADGKVKITMWHGFSEADGKTLESIVDDFNKSQDKYEIDAQLQPWSTIGETMVTMGGIITDGDMNALDANYEPIPGLYMAGNDCGRRFGTEYITPIPGVSLAFALVLGRECGKSVAKFLG